MISSLCLNKHLNAMIFLLPLYICKWIKYSHCSCKLCSIFNQQMTSSSVFLREDCLQSSEEASLQLEASFDGDFCTLEWEHWLNRMQPFAEACPFCFRKTGTFLTLLLLTQTDVIGSREQKLQASSLPPSGRASPSVFLAKEALRVLASWFPRTAGRAAPELPPPFPPVSPC